VQVPKLRAAEVHAEDLSEDVDLPGQEAEHDPSGREGRVGSVDREADGHALRVDSGRSDLEERLGPQRRSPGPDRQLDPARAHPPVEDGHRLLVLGGLARAPFRARVGALAGGERDDPRQLLVLRSVTTLREVHEVQGRRNRQTS
jgi:hypothetical protein